MVGIVNGGVFKTLQPMYMWSVFAINVVVTAASGAFHPEFFWEFAWSSNLSVWAVLTDLQSSRSDILVDGHCFDPS